MSRRKGEQPVRKPLAELSAGHPVVRMVANGDHWFEAWVRQECTPYARLQQLTGIPTTRLATLSRQGERVSRAEIDALARAWCVSSEGLISTLPDRSLVVE